MALGSSRAMGSRKRRVRDDWVQPLPAERHRLFGAEVGELEVGFSMFSVALDEAFTMRGKGHLVCARQQTAMAADLLDRLVHRLLGALTAVDEEARNLHSLPTVAPFRPEFFRGEKAVRAAWWNSILHGPLLLARFRLFHKLWTLRRTAAALRSDFRAAATDITEGTCIQPSSSWGLLEVLHFDLNTLLRETSVVLKSFLWALTTDEFESFQRRLARQTSLQPKPNPNFTGAST